ncbi:MAG TPA: BamA/TamA family outer membrane protein [Nannocystaceae bacterium]|nr:BamA/TamA family outer membrane protein [Nannocystaceae bacterium]
MTRAPFRAITAPSVHAFLTALLAVSIATFSRSASAEPPSDGPPEPIGTEPIVDTPTPAPPSDESPAEEEPIDEPPIEEPPADTPSDAAPTGTTPSEATTTPTTPTEAPPIEPGAPGDPLAAVESGLQTLKDGGIEVAPPTRTSNVLQGEVLTTTLSGTEHAYLLFVLEAVAAEGYLVLLRPAGRDRYELVALRARAGQERGLTFIGVDKLVIQGKYRGGESRATIEKLVDTSDGLLIPFEVSDTLRPVGYRATMRPLDDGVVELEVQPGRAIRRVRVHGHTPLFEREIRRALSIEARPGALAPGACVPRERLRTAKGRAKLTSLCDPDDRVCQAWERSERARIQRYLFDEGYLRGSVNFALACDPHDDDNVVLHVVLHKGSGYRVPEVKITGNLGTKDQRWVRRVFKPKFSPIVPLPKRVTRKHIEEAKERVEHEYATPRSSTAGRARRALSLPYPGVRAETNYDRLRRSEAPIVPKLPLVVDVQLGTGVDTDFLDEERVSENRLRAQLQLFERREAANAATAAREAANLRSYLQGRGYMLAKVDGQFQDFGTLHKLTFTIDEGARVRIRDVDIEQPEGVPIGVLEEVEREVVRARELKSGGRFTDAGARKDLGVILAAYAKRGYLCARAQVRVAFWKDGLHTPRAHAKLDLSGELEDSGSATWVTTHEGRAGFDPEGIAAIRGRRSAGLWVVVDVDPGPRVVTSSHERVRHLEVQIPGSREVESLPQTTGAWGAPRILRGGPLRRKKDDDAGRVPVDLTLDRDVERDVIARYQKSGYPLADAEVRWIYNSTDGRQVRAATGEQLTEADVGMCEEHADDPSVTVDAEIAVYEGRRARFGTTLVRGNFKTRYQRRNGKPAAIDREIEWQEGDPYDRGKVDRTRAGIDGMGVAESVQIRQQDQNCRLDSDPARPCVVHQLVTISEAKDRGMDLEWGFGGATLNPLYGFIRPTFPNMWGTAWDLSLDAVVGANLAALNRLFCVGEDCYERSGRINLRRQRIGGSPLTLDMGAQLQRRVTPARGQIDSALGHARLTWPISKEWSVYAGYLIQAANISKDIVKPALGADSGCGESGTASCRPPNRGEAIVPDRTAMLQTGARWERNVDNAFNPDKGIIATADAMFASPCFGGQDWWMRFDFGWEQFIPLRRTNKRLNFRYAITYGHEVPIPLPRSCAGGESRTQSVPEVWRYFGGGTRDLGLRGILPQTMLVDVEQIAGPYGVYTLRPTAQGGHIRALGTIALQLVTVRNFLGGRLAHSIFFDFGVLTQRWRQVVFNRDFRRSVGINFVKWDIKIVTVSLGYAVLIPNWIWPGNVRPTDDHNGRFVFDVGATF